MLQGLLTALLTIGTASAVLAQLPSVNDTLANGRKVAFTPFLGRFSVFTEIMGAAMAPGSLNLGYSVLKSESVLLDVTCGLTLHRMPGMQFNLEGYSIPAAFSFQLGRRKSRFNLKLGYFVSWTPGFADSPWPQCAGICPTPTQHRGLFSAGYVFQQSSGFFFGVHAYGFVHLIPREERYNAPMYKEDVFPWAGMTFGYRIPSQLQLLMWREHKSGRVLRSLDEKTLKQEIRVSKMLEKDSLAQERELKAISRLNERREKEVARMERIALRDNGPHNVFVEVLGPGHTWSVNYQHSRPLKENSIVHAFGRGGVGGISGGALNSNVALAIPFAGGIQLFKNYRGGGIGLGAVPVFRRHGNPTMLGFVGIDAHFHLAHGLTFGAGYQLMYDPHRAYGRGDLFMFGGFSLGYRFKKRSSA